MSSLVRKLWPLLVGLLLFVGISYFVQMHLQDLRGLLQGGSLAFSMAAFVLFGILTVMIPFGSIIPFLPVAVSLWGWPITALLTLCAWVTGGQILFELSRHFGKPWVTKIIPEQRLQKLAHLVKGKGIGRSILIRLIVHGDVVSYAFGLFTNVGRGEFFLVSVLGVAPAAVAYSYFGSLPLAYQLGIIGVVAFIAALYWRLEKKKPAILQDLEIS